MEINRMKINRFIALLMSLFILLGSGALLISAATPTYEVSKQYEKSKYYQNFKKVPLSGDQATDVVAIALSQLGYREGNSEKDLGGTSDNGVRDFVEYNVLYGKIDNNQGNGVSYGYYWCASFVNWCLRQAGVEVKDSAAAEISCRRWLQKCKDAGMYREKGVYAPVAGDLIFFKDSDSAVSSTHMGIVLYSDAKNVYTVEGNTTDDNSFSGDGSFVSLKSYKLTNSYIVGYAHPNYAKNDSVAAVDYSGQEMSGGLYVSQKEIQVFESREMTGEAQTIPSHEVFTVKEVLTDSFKVEYDADGKTVSGYAAIENKAVQMTALASLRRVDILDADGNKMFRTQYLLPATEIKIPDTIPERDDAGFLGWTIEGADPSAALYSSGDVIESEEKNISIIPSWDTNLYTVVFADEDGNIIKEIKGYYGDEYEIPAFEKTSPTKEFVRWEQVSSAEDSSETATQGLIKNNATFVAVMQNKDFVVVIQKFVPQIAAVILALAVILLGVLLLILARRKKSKTAKKRNKKAP